VSLFDFCFLGEILGWRRCMRWCLQCCETIRWGFSLGGSGLGRIRHASFNIPQHTYAFYFSTLLAGAQLTAHLTHTHPSTAAHRPPNPNPNPTPPNSQPAPRTGSAKASPPTSVKITCHLKLTAPVNHMSNLSRLQNVSIAVVHCTALPEMAGAEAEGV
jgi:hypothetical protein